MPLDLLPRDLALIYRVANTVVLVGWAILIFLPRRPQLLAIPKFVLPALFSLIYAGLTLPRFFAYGGSYDTLADVVALFSHDDILLGGWLHYLAYDLFIGAWIAEQADRIALSRLIQAGILVVAFIFPPVGFLLFLATRAAAQGAARTGMWRAAA